MTSGVVTKLFEKSWNGKVFYSLGLNDGNVYGFGTYKPDAKPGDQVDFESKTNQKGYWEAIKGTLRVTPGSGESAAQGASAAVVARGTKSAGSEDFWAKKELREVTNDHLRSLGASRNTAIEWIKTLIQADAVKLPAKQADKEAVLYELFNDYVAKFMEEVEGSKPSAKAATRPEEPAVDDSTSPSVW